jgi:serine/threonine-protein kinase
LGGVYLYLGRDEEAEREFKKSIAIKPTPGAYSNLATVYLLEHRFKQAVQILETIVTPDCKDYRLWGNLGDAYRWASGPSDKSARAYAEAIRLIRSCLVVNPKNATALAALATFLAKSANAAEAVARADQAVQLAPTDIEILFDAALGYELSGKRQQAIDALARAVQGGYSRNNIAKDVDLKNLRADPAAVAILGK